MIYEIFKRPLEYFFSMSKYYDFINKTFNWTIFKLSK